MKLLALTIFIGSFLVFQVEPLIAKYILPWFGGSSEVWTACMLFFQLALFGGYAYAHFIAGHFTVKKQVMIHSAVLLFSLLWLPITPAGEMKPDAVASPVLWVLLVLSVSVGWPFLIISSTAPLLQNWFTKAFPGHSPYRLYALSNAGSLLSLFIYPFVIEYWFDLKDQTTGWSIAYLAFVALCLITGLKVWSRVGKISVAYGGEREPENVSKATSVSSPAEKRKTVMDVFFWLLMSACGSVMLLASTNHMGQSVASVPFLWVLPLGIYLLSFILCFADDRWYHREWFGVLWIVALVLALWLDLGAFVSEGVKSQIVIYSFILFACCMVCHGELARLKPSENRLTLYYLVISFGGLLGGAFVTLVAPVIFTFFYEFYIGLIGSGLVLIVALRRARWQTLSGAALGKSMLRTCLLGLVMLALVYGASEVKALNGSETKKTIATYRDFYGISKIHREQGYAANDTLLSLTSGNTIHGFQFESEEKRTIPVCYYEELSGVGLAVSRHPKRLRGEPLKVGLIGLGVGTLAAYANEGDEFHFYEINPEIEVIARQYFTYLNDAEGRGAKVRVELGDARLVLDRKLLAGEEMQFDVLVLDAFNSDSVPVHLLTVEAFALYRRHLRAGGVLAVHVSNRYLDLAPVVRASLAAEGLAALQIFHLSTDLDLIPKDTLIESQWVLGTDDRNFFRDAKLNKAKTPWPRNSKRITWTDHYSSLFQVLK